MIGQMLLLTIGLPTALAFIGLLLLWKVGRKPLGGSMPWLSGLVIALSYLVGHYFARGFPLLPPVESAQWLFLLTIGAALVGTLDALGHRAPLGSQIAWRLVFCAITIALLVTPARSYLGPAKTATWVVVLSLLTTMVWTALNLQAQRQAGAGLPFVLSFISLAASAALVIGHTAAISQLVGIVASLMGSAFVVGLLQPSFSLANGVVAVFVTLLVGTTVIGMFFADLPAVTGLLVIVSPFATMVTNASFFTARPGWQRFLLQLLVVSLPLAVGIGIAVYQLGLPQL